jgi:Protein of unknown function DUF111
LHLHLDISGGLTGDMFIAAVLDAFPRFERRVIGAIDALDATYPVSCSLVAQSENEMFGHRFEIEPFVKYLGHIPHAFPEEPAHWDSVRERLSGAEIVPHVRLHATKIFELMVRAEAAAHGIAPERVLFETGAWNSIAQVVGAAALIDALDSSNWSVSALASGGAVSLAGAAIADYLCPPRARGRPLPQARAFVRSGTGFGLTSQRNHVRLLCFEAGEAALTEQADAPPPRHATRRPDQQTSQ